VPALLQVRERFLHEEGRTAQVHADRLVPRDFGPLPDRQRERVGRVVHDDVDRVVRLDGGRDERAHGVELGHVHRAPRRDTTRLADRGRSLLARVGLAARDHHVRSESSEGLGHRAPDAATAAGDDGDAAGEVIERVQELVAVHFPETRPTP